MTAAAFVIGANNVGMDTVEFYNSSDNPAAFSKSREQWGEFSNMCGGFPLIVNDLKFQSSEGLYQALKFPHNKDKQIAIAQATNGYWAKKVAYRKDGVLPYEKWDEHRIDAMRVSLAFKLAQHPKLSSVILATDNLDIVEKSKRDAFWGAQPVLSSYNVKVLDKDRIELSNERADTVNAVMNVVRKFEHLDFDLNPDFIEQILTMDQKLGNSAAVPNVIEVTGPDRCLAITKSDDGYQGANVLGKLWMNLRAHINGSIHNMPWMSALEFSAGSFRNEFMINRTALSPNMLMPEDPLNQRG